MRFEQALQAMREGKKVKRPIHILPFSMKQGRIVAVYKGKNGKDKYDFVEGMYTSNIIAGDWEVVENEPQS